MSELTETLTDVFMPEDLCARCGEQEPSAAISLVFTPSPSSTYSPTRIFFCGEECRDRFVVAAESVAGLGDA